MVALLTVAMFLGFLAIVALLIAAPIYLLWNWLCPSLFHLPAISLLQALGIGMLTSLLFPLGGRSK